VTRRFAGGAAVCGEASSRTGSPEGNDYVSGERDADRLLGENGDDRMNNVLRVYS
jgi:hypothetical protein